MWDLLVAFIILIESSGNPKAVSHANAVGLMQLTPIGVQEVRNQFGLYKYQCPNLFDPEVNQAIGERLLSFYLNQVADGDVRKAVVLYNAGYAGLRLYNQGLIHKVQETSKYLDNLCSVYPCDEIVYGPY